MDPNQTAETAHVDVENIGGIDSSAITLSSGVNVLVGRNTTNRTSMLRAIMAALGSDRVSLKGDADEGRVELELGDETYTRRLICQNGTAQIAGDPYLEDPEPADLFAFLLEDNDARQVIVRGDGLRDLIMRPVDTAAIEEEIERLQNELRDLDAELKRLDELESELPSLEQRRSDLQTQIDEKCDELETKRVELEEADVSLDESKEQRAQREAMVSELRDIQSSLEDVRYELGSERESLSALEDEKAEIEVGLDELTDVAIDEPADIEAEIERLRSHKQSLDTTISQLQQIIQFNQNMVEGDGPEFMNDVQDQKPRSRDGQLVTDRLATNTITCWTCGSTVESDAIGEVIDRLRDLHREQVGERNTITDELEDLKRRQKEIEKRRWQQGELEDRLESAESEISSRRTTIEELERQRGELKTEADELETRLNEVEEREEGHSELRTLHKGINRLDVEVNSLEGNLEVVESEIDEIAIELDRQDGFEARQSDLRSELTDLRTRIELLEAEATDEFNDHMQSLLELLEFENLDRIWLERIEQEVRD